MRVTQPSTDVIKHQFLTRGFLTRISLSLPIIANVLFMIEFDVTSVSEALK